MNAGLERAQALQDENWKQQMQAKIAPLSQAIQSDQVLLANFRDPKSGMALPGHEDDFNRATARIAQNVGKMRELLGDKRPHAGIFDVLHIHRDLAQRQDEWNRENAQQTETFAQSAIPFEMTAKGQEQAAQTRGEIEVAEARQKSNQKNIRNLKTGEVKTWDVTEPIPEGWVIASSMPQSKPVKGTLVKSSQSPTGFAQTYIDPQHPEKIVAWQPVTPSRWYEGFTSSSSSTDPFGVTTTSQHVTQPNQGGEVDLSEAMQMPGTEDVQGQQGTPAGTPPPSLKTAPTPVGPKTQKLNSLRGGTPKATASTSGAKLDDNGHIPDTYPANPMLRQAANQLLDGASLKDLAIPQKDKSAAEALAEKFGYGGQGMFTPRELVQVEESRQLIQKIQNDPNWMSVYHASPAKRAIISHLIHATGGKSITSSFGDTLAANQLNNNEIQFVQTYRQLIGRIQGLAQLTRGSGRPTEAAVKRMMAELPDPAIVSSPEEARHSFDLINNEIDIAIPKNKQQGGPGTQQLRQIQQQGVHVVSPEEM